jgi:hypothetical protein
VFYWYKQQQQQTTTSEEQMKFNQWTLGLAAVGVVSLASAVRADEAKVSQVQTALSSTTLSGYVDTAAQYNLGNQGGDSRTAPGVSSGKIDSFSLNDLDLALDKPQDDSPWASGYHVDLNWGTDAISALDGYDYNNPIRQAYIKLRTPVGNGINWQFGVFDNIIGYEGNTDYANPNYTRSYGYSIEPTSYVGALASYTFTSWLSAQAGIANSQNNQSINGIGSDNVSAKSYIAAIALTAPDSWGWLKGAALNLGVNDQNFGNYKGNNNSYEYNSQQNYYAGFTLPTPIAAVKLGGAFDWVNLADQLGNGVNGKDDSEWVAAAYASYQATDKLALNLRGEYAKSDLGDIDTSSAFPVNQAEEITATVSYSLWANVTSRAEFRWDHLSHGTAFGNGADANAYLLALNLIYQF